MSSIGDALSRLVEEEGEKLSKIPLKLYAHASGEGNHELIEEALRKAGITLSQDDLDRLINNVGNPAYEVVLHGTLDIIKETWTLDNVEL